MICAAFVSHRCQLTIHLSRLQRKSTNGNKLHQPKYIPHTPIHKMFYHVLMPRTKWDLMPVHSLATTSTTTAAELSLFIHTYTHVRYSCMFRCMYGCAVWLIVDAFKIAIICKCKIARHLNLFITLKLYIVSKMIQEIVAMELLI